MNISFRGSSDGIIFDDIDAMFRNRDRKRAEEAQHQREQNAQRAPRRSPSNRQPVKDEFSRTRTQRPSSTTSPNRAETSVRRKPTYKLKPRAYVLAALMLLSSAFGIKSCTNSPTKDDIVGNVSIVQEANAATRDSIEAVEIPYYVGDSENDLIVEIPSAVSDVFASTEVPEAESLETNLQNAMENSEAKQTFYDLQKTVERASNTLGEPLLPLLKEICDEHADGLDPMVPLIIIFMESRGLHNDANDGFMEMTPIAVKDIKERYGGVYEHLDPSNPRDNLILGVKFIELCYDNYTDGTNREMAERYNNCSTVQNIEGQDVVTKEWYGDKFNRYYNNVLDNPQVAQMLEGGLLSADDGQKSVELISPSSSNW